MPSVDRKAEGAGAPASGRSNALIKVAAVSTSVLLLGSAFQASFASSGRAGGISAEQYGNGGGNEGGGGGGLDGGTVAAIAVGGAALIAGGVIIANHHHHKKPKKSEGMVSAPPLPKGARGFTGVRLTPETAELGAGERQVVDLQVRWQGAWYSVTDRPEATIRVAEAGSGLVPMDGAKNAFCVPANFAAAVDGREVLLVGTFAPAGEAPLSAQAHVALHPGAVAAR